MWTRKDFRKQLDELAQQANKEELTDRQIEEVVFEKWPPPPISVTVIPPRPQPSESEKKTQE